MCKVFIFIIAFICFFQATEGVTSQVHYQEIAASLEEVVNDSDNVVIVKPSDKWEVYLEKKISPKAGLPPPDEVYQEHIYLYEVVAVLKSKTIKPGQIIKVWDTPTFSYEEMKDYYERQIRRSPIVYVYKALREPVENQNFILLLKDKEPDKLLFRRVGNEGLATQSDIENFLKVQP